MPFICNTYSYYKTLNNDYFQYYPLKCIEIENLMRKDQLIKILKHFEVTKLKMDKAKFARKDYKQTGLGKVLNKAFETNVFSAESGTLKPYYKKRFYEIFQQIDINWDTMTKDTKDLIRNLYDFIKRHNS